MKTFLLLLPLLLFLAACGGRRGEAETAPEAGGSAVSPQDLAGQWAGTINIIGQELAINVSFFADGDNLSATIDIPQQGAAGLPLGAIELDGRNLRFAIEQVGAEFEGTVEGDTISGDFRQSVARGSFTLNRTGEAAVAPTATPVPPYRVEELVWNLDDTTLTGTLTLPETNGPFPAVLFIAGSGPTDRNWNSPLLPGTNGSAALLADELTKAGYATLRFDKRVTGPNAAANVGALAGKISMQSHLDEVTSALAQLTARPEVDAGRVYVLANSEGTLHAMNAQNSAAEPPFAGLILAAPPGRRLGDVLLDQVENNLLAGDPNAAQYLDEFSAALADFMAGGTPEPGADWPEALQTTLAGLITPINLPFARELMVFDPAAALTEVKAPVLVVIGQKDIQVDWQADGDALAAAAGDNVTFRFPPDANHVLKLEPKAAGELTAADAVAYNAPDRVLDPEALQTILNWLAAEEGVGP